MIFYFAILYSMVCQTVFGYSVLCYAMPCCIMLCYAMIWYDILCYPMRCCVILHYVMLYAIF